jgi:hypothetical protein
LATDCNATEDVLVCPQHMRKPASSRSNTRSRRDLACIETGGELCRHITFFPTLQVDDHYVCPSYEGMINIGVAVVRAGPSRRRKSKP